MLNFERAVVTIVVKYDGYKGVLKREASLASEVLLATVDLAEILSYRTQPPTHYIALNARDW